MPPPRIRCAIIVEYKDILLKYAVQEKTKNKEKMERKNLVHQTKGDRHDVTELRNNKQRLLKHHSAKQTTKTSNGLVLSKQVILGKLWAIARARTEEEFKRNIESLKSSTQWKENTNFKSWIEKTWLPKYKVKVMVFQTLGIILRNRVRRMKLTTPGELERRPGFRRLGITKKAFNITKGTCLGCNLD